MFPTGDYDPRRSKRIAMASHGMSVVKIRRDGTRRRLPRSPDSANPYNRRLHTRHAVPGRRPRGRRRPADDAPRRPRRAARVLGTLNNCAGGLTPWGTVLSGEENFNQYFEQSGTCPAEYAASYARYGITRHAAPSAAGARSTPAST